MLTKEDIKLLTEYQEGVFVTKAEFRQELGDVKDSLRTLQTSVDGLAKLVKDFRDEHIVLYKRIETLESWAKKVGEKLGISLSF